MGLVKFFRTPGISAVQREKIIELSKKAKEEDPKIPTITDIQSETCFYVEAEKLGKKEEATLEWLLHEPYENEKFGTTSFLTEEEGNSKLIELGPRLNFSTAWSTNACNIYDSLTHSKQFLKKFEFSRRILFKYSDNGDLSTPLVLTLCSNLYDRMTSMVYPAPLESFNVDVLPTPVSSIPLIENGRIALEKVNTELGLAMDDYDFKYYSELFTSLGRDPTDVEIFDLAQSNSEHCRHWFFCGKLVIDGTPAPKSLMSIVKETLTSPNNSVIAFHDNSSALKGFRNMSLMNSSALPEPLILSETTQHFTFSAETHNFPTGVAPFPGAETGTGGRIRDTHAAGSGSLVVASTASYAVGNLYIPDYPLPWENSSYRYPENLSAPLEIIIEASNGASDYGNKFGEPVIQGYSRSFGMNIENSENNENSERREYIKPIMLTAGIGKIDDRHVTKGSPEKGMIVVKLGGPAYRIGMGGGAASSLVQGSNTEELDFSAVQRGDAMMEQKLNRVIRSCVELGDKNPIISIHDQGAGGCANVVQEIVDPAGAAIDIRKVVVGDSTLSVLEIWGAEYQEQDAILINPENRDLLLSICSRENLPVAFIGTVTGDGKIVLKDSQNDSVCADLELTKILGKMPQKKLFT